ncbi:unnamed protein product [Closterium sp. NIES-54]
MVSTTITGGRRVAICTCARTGRHLAAFTCRPQPSLYTLTTEPPQVAAFGQVSASPPPSPAPPCLPCFKGRQRAAPHSSSFPSTSAPLQTLHMDVWGPARVSGQDRERYFLLVVDDYMRYTTVFSLRSKGEVPDVLIPWIRAIRLQLRERLHEDLPVLRLHSDRGGEFSSDLLWDFCRGEGILQSVLGLRLSCLSPSISADKLSSRAIPCDVMFDESIPFYRLFPYRTAPLLPPPLFLAPGPPPVDPLPPQGPAPSGVSQVDPLAHAKPERAEPRGAEPESAETGGAESEGAEPRGAEPESAEPGGTEPEGAESGGAEPRETASTGGPAGASPRQSRRRDPLSPRQLREWFSQRTCLRSGAVGAGGPAAGGTRAGGAGATSPGGARVTTGAGGTGGVGAAGPGGARTRGIGAAGAGGVGGARASDSGAGGTLAGGAGAGGFGARDPGAGGAGAGGAGARGARAGDPGAGGAGAGGNRAGDHGAGGIGAGDLGAGGAGAGGSGAGGTGAEGAGAGGYGGGGARAGGVGAPGTGAGGAGAGDLGAGGAGAAGTVQRRPFFVQPSSSSLPPPSLVLCQVLSLLSSTGLTPPLLCPLPHQSQPQLQLDSPLPALSPYAGQIDSLTKRREPASRPALPVCDVCTGRRVPPPRPSPVPSTHIMALRPSSVPQRVPMPSPLASSLADSPDPESDLVHAAKPTVTRLLATVVPDPSFESTAASALVPGLVDFAAACRLDYATSLVLQCFGFQYSSPQSTPLPTGLSLLAPPSDESVEPSGPYPELVGCLMYLMTRTRPYLAYPLSILACYVAPGRHRPEHWEAAKRVLRYLCSTLGMGLVLGGRGPVVLTRHADVSWVDDLATQRSSQGYTFSLGSDSVSWWSTRSSSVPSSSCEAEIYAGAMAAQELRWLTYLLIDLGERPRSPPVLYVDNKAMIALC